MKELSVILTDFERGWNNMLEQRDKVIEDQRFVDVDGAQWEGQCGERFGNKPKLEFDKITREINRIIGEYNSNPVSVKFLPNDENAEQDVADILQDRFRNDSRKSDGQEAGDNAFAEAIKGGYGALRIMPEFEDKSDPDKNKQFISFDTILSAASVVVRDADAKKFDKSDAEQTWLMTEFSRHKFDEKWPGKAPWPQGQLNATYEFDWYGTDVVYVAEYFEVIEEKVKRIVFEKPDGTIVKFLQSEIKSDDNIAFEASLYEQIDSEMVMNTFVERSLLCGDSVLEKPVRIPGKFIPIIDFYGYRSYIKGKEYYMGEVRKQRDRQMFNNMAVSMLSQIMTESQREKMIFAPEQITPEIAKQWADDNIENYPYLLAKPIRDASGNIQNLGPIGKTSAPQVPPAMLTAMQMINQDMAEEMGNGSMQVNSNTSGEAISMVQGRADMSMFILLHNARKSWKFAGKVYMEMAKELYGVNRMMRTLADDGSVNMVEMQQVDLSSGFPEVKNDVTTGSFEIVTETGPSYSSRKEAERATILEAMQVTDSNNPMFQLMYSELLQTMDGEGSSTIRKVAKFNELQYLLTIDPQLAVDAAKTDEEKAYIERIFQEMQQPPPPDPIAEIARIDSESKNLQAQSSVMKAQTDQAKLQLEAIDTQSQATLREAQTVETYAKAQEISQKSTRESMKLVSDIRNQQVTSAFNLAKSLRG